MWNVINNQLMSEVEGHTEPVTALCLPHRSPDSSADCIAVSGAIVTPTHVCVCGRSLNLLPVAVGDAIAGSEDKTIRVWNLNDPRRPTPVRCVRVCMVAWLIATFVVAPQRPSWHHNGRVYVQRHRRRPPVDCAGASAARGRIVLLRVVLVRRCHKGAQGGRAAVVNAAAVLTRAPLRCTVSRCGGSRKQRSTPPSLTHRRTRRSCTRGGTLGVVCVGVGVVSSVQRRFCTPALQTFLRYCRGCGHALVRVI